MSLVPAVTELLMAELMYLQYDSPTKPIFMYINSAGVQVPNPAHIEDIVCLYATAKMNPSWGHGYGALESCVVQKGAETLGYEFEALAIYDLMRYVKPSVSTLCVGNAFGEAAMLLSAGEKVHLYLAPLHPLCALMSTAIAILETALLEFSSSFGLWPRIGACRRHGVSNGNLVIRLSVGEASLSSIWDHHASATDVSLHPDASHRH
jgi:hypothetical protein